MNTENTYMKEEGEGTRETGTKVLVTLSAMLFCSIVNPFYSYFSMITAIMLIIAVDMQQEVALLGGKEKCIG